MDMIGQWAKAGKMDEMRLKGSFVINLKEAR
jgi:hypothetical protein